MNNTQDSGLLELAEQVSAMEKPGLLRFSECIIGGLRGYQWGQVRAGAPLVVRYLCACWNERAGIAAALRSRAAMGEQPVNSSPNCEGEN